MFGFGKKKKQEEPAPVVATAVETETLVAPVDGQYKRLADVSDPVFSQGNHGRWVRG